MKNTSSNPPRIKTIMRALKMSLQIKSRLSVCILILGVPAALLPAAVAKNLQLLTDRLLSLQNKSIPPAETFAPLAVLLILFFCQLCMQALQGYVDREDEINGMLFLKKSLLSFKCRVKYPYIENDDRFQERLELVTKYAGDKSITSVSKAAGLLTTAITFLSVTLLLWTINPWIVLLVLATSIPAALITYKQNDDSFYFNLYWSENSTMVLHYYGIIAEEHQMQELRHFGLYDYLLGRWHSFADAYMGEKKKILAKHVGMNAGCDFLRNIVYVAVLSIAVWQIYQNPLLGLGLFTMVFSLTGQLQTAASNLLAGSADFLSAAPYMQELFYLQDLPEEEMGEDKEVLKEGKIEYRNVSFSYPGTDREVLKEIHVTINDGEKIAIVGENGSGKSTFVSLLCGMLEPERGEILVGGVNAAKEAGKVRNTISVVFQDFAHYEDTLRNNITVSQPEKPVSDEEINSLLKKIHLNEVIEKQELGLDSKIGSFSQNSNNLSGGQWQKLALARAAYRDRGRIIVLDEPTSALDPIAEAQLYQDFYHLTGDKTTLLISHRLGITSVVDRILVFHDGRIVEDGSHAELMAKKGYYHKMYQAQAQWYE